MYKRTLNVEIKARCAEIDRVREQLRQLKAVRRGRDVQTDTYFVVPDGRMKLREGTIENSLIYYRRDNKPGPKVSEVSRFDLPAVEHSLGNLLSEALGVFAVVRKTREIYFLSNVKIHLDNVEGLGSFLEIEAIDSTGRRTRRQLRRQCQELMKSFGVSTGDLVEGSYSDMLSSHSDDHPLADAA